MKKKNYSYIGLSSSDNKEELSAHEEKQSKDNLFKDKLFKETLFKERKKALPSMSIKDEWILFCEIFLDDRPRLQNVLKSAAVSDDGSNHIIEIPVRNRFQEDWLKAGSLDEIRALYHAKCGHPEEKYQIILKHSDDYSFS